MWIYVGLPLSYATRGKFAESVDGKLRSNDATVRLLLHRRFERLLRVANLSDAEDDHLLGFVQAAGDGFVLLLFFAKAVQDDTQERSEGLRSLKVCKRRTVLEE